MQNGPSQPPPLAPHQAVGKAIQDLAAARLGRGFVPLALLFAGGVGEWVLADGGVQLAAGALVAGGAMLAYGLKIVQKAFGREHRHWMSAAMIASVVPPAYALYVLGWRGLRGLFAGGGLVGFGLAILFTAMGVWVLRCWMKVVEVEGLARVMDLNMDEKGDPA